MRKIFTISAIIVLFNLPLFAQGAGYSAGYYKKLTSVSIGYLKTTLVFPDMKDGNGNVISKAYEPTQGGIMFTYTYNVAELADIPVGKRDQISLDLEGNFRLGFSMGREDSSKVMPVKQKFYTGTADFFALDFTPSYTHVFSPTMAVTAKLGITIFNIGASIASEENSNLEDSYAIASIIPFAFRPSISVDFGKGAVGVALYFNKNNLFGYSYTKDGVLNNDYRGFVSKTLLNKFAVEFLYSF